MQPVNKNGRNNNSVIRPRPTKASGIAYIIGGALFLLFSAVPFSAAEGEARPFAVIFGGIWVCACLSIIIYGIYIVVSDKPSSGMVFDIEGNISGTDAAQDNDFDARIRKLAKLKEDRLITEEEYQRKRSEMMDERW
jgi:hypothetical protein